MNEYKVTIKGIRPLLQNKKVEMETEIKKRGEEKDSPECCKNKLYKLNNKIVQPAEMIERAMTKNSGQFKMKGAGKKSYKDLIAGSVFVEPEFIEHKNQKWIVDCRTVVIPATRGRINRYRPRFDDWELTFNIRTMDDRISEDILKNILDEAGRLTGIGDGRAIGMGRFIVTEYKEDK